MKKITGKFLGIITSMACMVSAVSVTAVAEQNSEKINYENQFIYEKVDADENGTYDYIGIYSCNTDAAEVNVPEEIDGFPVEWIFDSAFYNAKNLKVINLPKTIKQLGYRSLYNTSLEVINVDAENTEFSSEDGVLFDKEKETLIQYPSSKAGEVYTVPATVTSVLGFSFEECKNLKNVTLSKNVNYLGNGAFEKCSALESVTFENPDCQFVEFAVSITNGYVDSKGYYNGVIYGYENSTAQAYAEKYDYNFAVIGAEPETTKPVVTEPAATTFVTTISNNELVASVRCDGCDGVIHGGPEWFVVTPQGTTLCLNCSEQNTNDTTEALPVNETTVTTVSTTEKIYQTGGDDCDHFHGTIITDISEISKMLSGFIAESDLAARTFIDETFFDGVIVEIQEYWNKDAITESIKAFIKENNINESEVEFIVLEGGMPEQPADAIEWDNVLYGDIDCNTDISIADVIIISKYIINENMYPLKNATAKENADCSYDNVVDSKDALKLTEYSLGSVDIMAMGPADKAGCPMYYN